MDISSYSAQLLSKEHSPNDLPTETLDILREGSNAQYLEELSQLALQPTYTTAIFITHEPIFVEICSRWLTASALRGLSALAALARILPSAPYLSVYARALLGKFQHGALQALGSGETSALQDLSLEKLHALLVALYRLLAFDNDAFASKVSPAQLQLLLKHPRPHIRYLAMKILCLYLHASDAALVSMIKTYIGEEEIQGPWEDKSIDYAFFDLWEDKRLEDLGRRLSEIQEVYKISPLRNRASASLRIVALEDLSRTTACVGGVLLPRLDEEDPAVSSIVMTDTVLENMRSLARSVRGTKPLLVTGFSGAGKTSLIRDVARELGKSSTMVTLHLNEQIDAKLLIGMYTSQTPGSFIWRPGVLTTAVTEGRWVFIEDLDRAPTEIISTLLPLLERGELLVPNWGQTIRAAPGFKVIATVRSAMNSRGEEYTSAANLIGIRQWQQVRFQTPTDRELAYIATTKHPILRAHLPKFMDVYHNLQNIYSSHTTTHFHIGRLIGPQDLLKWCSRVEDLLRSAGVSSDHEALPEAINDNIFLEAVDCLLGAFPSGASKAHGIGAIAQGLHMPAERAQYCLDARKPEYQCNESLLRVGRVGLPRRKRAHGAKSLESQPGASPFVTTNDVLRVLESVAVSIKQGESCLLVGETGTGKTTIVQRLADVMNRKLTVVNLSQQSEAGDLLGGFKPVNMRALAVPMKEEFDELMDLTFSSKRNQHYVDALGKSISKGRWPRALTLWQEALRMIESHLKPGSLAFEIANANLEPSSKRRKLQTPKIQRLKSRWEKFASDVQTFQMHLSSGSKGFAFSYVEGNIIKAARNGDWVLLDEINLASPDILESLADLFSSGVDSSPSILLTETGHTERIQAHKDFRIFGAMNPATDVGKRDIPLSLRSKFTELFVEAPDRDLENLVPIVKAYLGNHNHVDVRAATDVANLYLKIKNLSNENLLVDGANQKPHFSLRTLSRTLVYVLDIAPIYGLRRALFEGFSMSFLTVLNRDSELLLQPIIDRHILGSQKNSVAILHQTPRIPQDSKHYVQFRHYWVAQGAAAIEEQSHYIITPFIERNLLNLVRATSTRRFPVLLQGPTSSGKTSMIEHLARISGNKFVRINNHEHTDLQEYLGTYVSGPDGRLQFQEGILVHALREGYWVVLDELNLAPTDVLEALNRLLDDNRELLIPETQQVVRPHRNFMLFATQNPPGMYGGRKVLSRAFRNRFLELHFDDIPEEELETILRERSQIAPSFCARIVAVYKKLSILRQRERLFEQKNSFATLRDLFRWALRKADDCEQLAVNGFLLLAERVRNQEERLAVRLVIEDVMKVKIDLDQVYGVSKIKTSLATSIASPRGIVWTKSMRRLFVLVTEALKNNEPVLLVGETGSGKTTVCQAIAELTDTELHIVNAHQNMETSDLIGAQRPIRNRDYAESQLAQELLAVLKDCGAYNQGVGHDLSALLEVYDRLQLQEPTRLTDEIRLHIEKTKVGANALFEWADGSLVHAMKQGHHFLLDEISLADDSVLERLNSVLEPGRTLLLAEKGINDASLKALPGFQFLATMNPGGDYGKRELSPALRNRFTEIWVPHASEEDEMLEIAQAKLKSVAIGFAEPMVEFAAWYSMTYIPGAPHISIRDLLAWIQFVNMSQLSDLYCVLLHGAAMVYIDGLGANPASKLSITNAAVPKERRSCLLALEKLFAHDVPSKCDEDYEVSITELSFSIGPFSLMRRSKAPPNTCYSLQAPTTTKNAMKILRALQIQKPILLEGSPGVGKTTLVAALAQVIGMPLTRINLSDQTDLMDLFGSDVPIEGAGAGKFAWRDAPFLRAMQKGEWVLLDEMNLASQSILEGLNACLDHRGQVYVSELDQNFERHPDFVVFAAQNPHHQGGGRKGLPASFVNRFTVVYADMFTAEDLSVITSQMYPQVSRDVTENILKSVDALSQLLQQDRRVGAQGGPWEINLRDVLRWLHLLTNRGGLMPLAKAADYLQLLFLQRFRTLEDIAAVSRILPDIMPQPQPRTYFHSKSEHMIEIGLGLLPRNKLVQPISSQRRNSSVVNLPLAESMMLCIESNWPCLLVGPSGSGKTQLIIQLASAAGADVLDLSLNSEMDTMDLVGGYEQLDPRREVPGFVDRLQAYTRSNVIRQLASADGYSKSMSQMEEELRESAIEPAEIHQLLLNAVEEHPSSGFPDFLAECKNLIQQSTNENKARFEWVDGILIKALKQGKWLILDNANLCSPSVLDRLNSLLEPNGFLSINEHRNSDGSAKMVKPHLDFRLFLTMDPRHGELSRAMRNRSIELFMPLDSPSPKFNVLSSRIEPTVSRFQMFQSFDWNRIDDTYVNELLAICLDHLTFQDLAKVHRWQSQFVNGLNELSSAEKACLSSLVNSYQQLFRSGGVILKGIEELYGRIPGVSGTSSELCMLQSVHPYNNPVLLSDKGRSHLSGNLRWLGDCFELLLEIYGYGQQLASAAEAVESKTPAQMSRLERSLASAENRRFQNDSTQPLAAFLQDMGLCLRNCVDSKGFIEAEDAENGLLFTKELLFFLKDVFDLSHSSIFDEGAFQVYQTVGRSIVAHIIELRRSESLTSQMAHELNLKLNTFNSSWQLYSGARMEQLWHTFRPAVASSLSQLKCGLQVRELAERFDALKWSSGASVQELDMLRDSIVRMHNTITNSWQEVGPLKDVQRSVEQLIISPGSSQSVTVPYFQSQFEILCQYEACSKDQGSSQASSVISLLAGRPTSQLMACGQSTEKWNSLAQVQLITASGQRSLELAAIRNVLPVTMLQKLHGVSEVPLQSLALLSTEMTFLGKEIANSTDTISGNPLGALELSLKSLQEQTEAALSIPLLSEEFESIEQYVRQLPIRLNAMTPDQSASSEQIGHLHECLASAVDSQDSSPHISELIQTSYTCIHFFTGLLLLYVPDRVFDPALRPMVEQSRHKKRKAEMQNKLQALREFETVFSGQSSSFRIELAEQKLQALGAEPQVPSIVRPQISELGKLQAEFNNVLKTIILRSPSSFTSEQVFSSVHETEIQELRLLRTNIRQAVTRLSHGFHAYEDITRPLIAMLQGLDAGLALALLARAPATESDSSVQRLCAFTPFLGAGPNKILKLPGADFPTRSAALFDYRTQFLKSFALARSVNADLGESPTQTMFQAFHSLFEEWRDKLGRDQQQNAAKSSLYRYRGSEDNSNEADEQDFQQLFPNYSDASDNAAGPAKAAYDPREQARNLASLQRQIFQDTEQSSTRILDMVRNASHIIARNWQDGLELSKSLVPSENLLSAVILSLAESKERLHDQAMLEKLYNFYTDANLPEVQKLITLVHRIQTKFTELQEAWPEHTTLDDVLRTSSELLTLRHTEPIAKLLTKAEQLHGYIHEWQVVASKQYTTFSFYDQLTDMLISWRRLELSTWAQLLDMEDQKCNDDADSWWFVAYESIVAAPLSMVDAGEDLLTHAERMFSTLSDFLATTSMGQYSHRLAMIDCFKSHLELLTKKFPVMSVIHNASVNFLSFYNRFKDPVRELLVEGRRALEKDIKEILLLASWKDTNIVALRDSAKRLHHKLFKVVRKYRTLLAQPSETIISQRFPDRLGQVSVLKAVSMVARVDSRALNLCQQSFVGWQTKAKRFTNPSSTGDRMVRMSHLPPTAIDGASYLDTYGSELVDSIKALQKNTPSKVTEENTEAIKHLKARKRKLYAETLKDLRQMGFRSNLNASTLAKQASLSAVLTHSPAFAGKQFTGDIDVADYYFHKLLNVMPQLKERLRTHSEDLTKGEVARSLGYLESMVSVVLKQRSVIASAMTDLDQFETTTRKLQNVWAPDSYKLSKQSHDNSNIEDIYYILKWLPGILEAGSVIVQKHARMGERDSSSIIESLSQWKEKVENALKTFGSLPVLPADLSSTQHEAALLEGERLLQNCARHLQGLISQNPHLAFVLRQIELWTTKTSNLTKDHLNGEQLLDIKDFDNSLSGTADSILVAMQRMQEACSSVPISDEDPTWLIRTDASLSTSLKELHVDEVNLMLQDVMSRFSHLDTKDDGKLGLAAALCAMAMPIVEQYRNIQQGALSRHLQFHQSLCRLASLLAYSFSQIAQEGFCSPAENEASEPGKTEKLEGGTGLGEGVGSEDISKDIQDDEDLSELAETRNKDDEKEDIDDQENAVNMDQDELDGELGDVSDKGEDGDSGSDGEEDGIDEETGDVDDLHPSAVDEKLWDGKSDEKEKEKEGAKTKGKAEKRDQAAANSAEKQEAGLEDGDEQDDDVSQEGAEEGEEVAKEETEKMDPHAQDGQNLDLPEEMDLDSDDGTDAEGESGDSDIDAMSDVEHEQVDETGEQKDEDGRDDEMDDMANSPQDGLGDYEQDEAEAQDAGEASSPVDTDPGDDKADDQGLLLDFADNAAVDPDNTVPSDVRGLGQDMDQQDEEVPTSVSETQASKGTKGSTSNLDEMEAAAKDGNSGESNAETDIARAHDEPLSSDQPSQAFKKLGDALERWHRQNRQIQDAAEQGTDSELPGDELDRADQDFEHLRNEDAEADAQALGAATNDQARGLDEKGLESEMLGNGNKAENENLACEEISQEGAEDQDEAMKDQEAAIKGSKDQQVQPRPGVFISSKLERNPRTDEAETGADHADEEVDALDNDLSTTHFETAIGASSRSAEEARRLWSHYESITRELSLSLTEQLRLILAPTLATKMRGDFRTGKRLNIKRIIPYIASQYKRDKIWMRRSIPSKRNYQIMLAVDDSRSMGDSGSGQLAFETLALVAKSLSMLEVGAICVVGFGTEVQLAHPFEKPFSSEAGSEIFQHFGFQQTKTNVQKLVSESITLFREARRKTFNTGTDLWQLELIISDGVCEDHDTIRRLVCQAQEERIMIVFVIVDALRKEESILDMSQAVFESDAAGDTKLKIKRYLDSFPFPYYVVVGNVKELPGVLAQALRQWFAEVVERG